MIKIQDLVRWLVDLCTFYFSPLDGKLCLVYVAIYACACHKPGSTLVKQCRVEARQAWFNRKQQWIDVEKHVIVLASV
jgi:hypothetical protein